MEAGELFIVAGDLNDGRGQPALRRLQGYDGIQPDLIQTGDIAFFERADWGTCWTYEFEGTRNQIDHFLLSRVRGNNRPWREITIPPELA